MTHQEKLTELFIRLNRTERPSTVDEAAVILRKDGFVISKDLSRNFFLSDIKRAQDYGERIIKAEAISYSYANKKAALNAMDFSALEGEFVAMIGPPESGKSTLIKIITGELKPESGAVSINGKIGVDIFVYDEPTAGANYKDIARVLSEFTMLNKIGKTIIFSTSLPQAVSDFAHRVFVINGGAMYMNGLARSIFAKERELRGIGINPPTICALSSMLGPTILTVEEFAYSLIKKEKPKVETTGFLGS